MNHIYQYNSPIVLTCDFTISYIPAMVLQSRRIHQHIMQTLLHTSLQSPYLPRLGSHSTSSKSALLIESVEINHAGDISACYCALLNVSGVHTSLDQPANHWFSSLALAAVNPECFCVAGDVSTYDHAVSDNPITAQVCQQFYPFAETRTKPGSGQILVGHSRRRGTVSHGTDYV